MGICTCKMRAHADMYVGARAHIAHRDAVVVAVPHDLVPHGVTTAAAPAPTRAPHTRMHMATYANAHRHARAYANAYRHARAIGYDMIFTLYPPHTQSPSTRAGPGRSGSARSPARAWGYAHAQWAAQTGNAYRERARRERAQLLRVIRKPAHRDIHKSNGRAWGYAFREPGTETAQRERRAHEHGVPDLHARVQQAWIPPPPPAPARRHSLLQSINRSLNQAPRPPARRPPQPRRHLSQARTARRAPQSQQGSTHSYSEDRIGIG